MSVLPDAERFRRVIDGSARGPAAAAARCGLALLALPYGAAVALRNAAYDRGVLRRHDAGVPVVCVGNLTLGGTGKTPLVAWVVNVLRGQGIEPAIVSRGYGAARGTTSDEAAELALVLGGVNHVADRDRVAAARRAARHGAMAVVLDDGFQHRRLARDLDIVAVDATDPYGGGRLFPRGMLREPLAAIRRAGAVVITRAGAVDAALRRDIRQHFERACPRRAPAVWAEADHVPVRLRAWDGAELPLAVLAGARVTACAGIGNPRAFRHTLAGLGAHVAHFRAFADHHAYGPADLDLLAGDARRAGAAFVATTVKDLVKLRQTAVDGRPLVAIEIALAITTGREELERRVLAAVHADASPR